MPLPPPVGLPVSAPIETDDGPIDFEFDLD
jgi:hypothetical protein